MDSKKNKAYNYFVVMEFETEISLGVSSKPNVWVNTHNTYFTDSVQALHHYMHTNATMADIVGAEDEYTLQCKMGEMILNFMDSEWVSKNKQS